MNEIKILVDQGGERILATLPSVTCEQFNILVHSYYYIVTDGKIRHVA